VAEHVRDIMDASPASVTADASVEDVVKLLQSHELPGVPVVDPGGRLVGIVTEADLVLPDDQGDLHIPHYVNLFGGTVFLEPLGRFEKRLRKAFASTAADMMTADPDTVGPDATAQEAARLIHESGHNRLPVVDDDGRLVGVVTRVDVLGALAR
jgi:CBS domain-containing protein